MPRSRSHRAVVVISRSNVSLSSTIRTSWAKASSSGSSHSRNSSRVARASSRSSDPCPRSAAYRATARSNVSFETIAAYRTACRSMCPPSPRFNSTTTTRPDRSSPSRSIRRPLSAQSLASSVRNSVSPSSTSGRPLRNRWRSCRSRMPAAASVVGSTSSNRSSAMRYSGTGTVRAGANGRYRGRPGAAAQPEPGRPTSRVAVNPPRRVSPPAPRRRRRAPGRPGRVAAWPARRRRRPAAGRRGPATGRGMPRS